MKLRDLLEKRFSEKDLEKVKGSFDMIGDTAILEIPDELSYREKDIIDALLEIHPHINTVYKKGEERKGKFRLRELVLIHGEEKETEHREHGMKFRIDLRKVYFSPREGTERQRIVKQVKANETVMIMFAGAGPYAIAIAKGRPDVSKVYAVEMNPDGYKYMLENVRINKVGHKVVPILGDVEEKCIPYFGKCDRVVMPLPKGANEYIGIAVRCLKKKGGVIHYYFWSSEDALDEIKEIIEVDVGLAGRKIKRMQTRKVSEYKPKVIKFCADMTVI